MPIRIPDNLPARKTLEQEGVYVMDSSRASRQDIRPLEFGLLNLMPNKERTETQFTRLIGSTPLQVNLSLVHQVGANGKFPRHGRCKKLFFSQVINTFEQHFPYIFEFIDQQVYILSF